MSAIAKSTTWRWLLSALILLAGNVSVSADDTEVTHDDPQAVAQRWYAANVEYTGVTTTHTVTQRFEMYNPHSREQLQSLKAMGFTQVILDWPNLHADASELGLNVVLANWWIDTTKEADIDRGFRNAKEADPHRLAGISMMDEPERNAPDTPLSFYEELYDRLRPRLDSFAPATKLEISHWGPTWSWSDEQYDEFVPLYRSADVMRIMPFPDLHEGPLSDVFFMMARSRRLMRRAGRDLPLLVILQTWTLTPDADLPSIGELRVMAYQVLLSGAQTLSFFDYNQEIWDKTPGFHDEFAALIHELTQLSQRLADSRITTTMSADGILHATATGDGSQSLVICVNTNRHSVNGLDPLAVVESPPSQSMPLCQPVATCCPPTCAAPRAWQQTGNPPRRFHTRNKCLKRCRR